MLNNVSLSTEGGIDNTLLVWVGINTSEFYYFMPMILFVCLIWVASNSTRVLVENVQNLALTHDMAGHRVMKWKKSYHLIVDYVEEIDRFFSPLLVIFFCNTFVEFVLRSSSVVTYEQRRVANVIGVVRLLLIMGLIIHATEKLKEKVRRPSV